MYFIEQVHQQIDHVITCLKGNSPNFQNLFFKFFNFIFFEESPLQSYEFKI